MLQDVEFRLRARVDTSSYEAMLIKYLNSKNTLYPAKDMVMIAITSYWLPLAYQTMQQKSPDLEQQIRACIYRLQLHQEYLLGLLGETLSQGVGTIDTKRSPKEVSLVSNAVPEQTQQDTNWLNPFGTFSK
ncbi:hypothetical protein H6G80_33645 [Nostoc sp. FACHB-87]|uniref:hypothetical protein n=1 Tax=Nostocales TaxID=1161 RepID=UPI001686F5CD|nr:MULTISPECIES: hypothetical protein [Nostocales]MBD2303399.1 hypothetical protein [Nostoc sp. FACHB-190]MBD2458982.1 hypothetical protein [Nostoc sp. FACHB-87]MBD2479993.1 hypothetical protein [Anabaena sp. FACHB-83]MBD2492461.1 hypothetical protein [Aulosira sp. FACHB-615]